MKKLLNILTIISVVIIACLTVLIFANIIALYLWVKYLYLLSSLFVLVFLYSAIGKRTLFDECIYCLTKAKKGLQKQNFNKKDRLVGLELLRIKNYLNFATRYLDELITKYDLYFLKEPNSQLEEIINNVTSNTLKEVQKEMPDYIKIIDTLTTIVTKENQSLKDKILKEKATKLQKAKTKK